MFISRRYAVHRLAHSYYRHDSGQPVYPYNAPPNVEATFVPVKPSNIHMIDLSNPSGKNCHLIRSAYNDPQLPLTSYLPCFASTRIKFSLAKPIVSWDFCQCALKPAVFLKYICRQDSQLCTPYHREGRR